MFDQVHFLEEVVAADTMLKALVVSPEFVETQTESANNKELPSNSNQVPSSTIKLKI